MIPVVVVGASGRMGRAIERAAEGQDGLAIVARVDQAGARRAGEKPGAPGTDPGYVAGQALADVARAGDVVVEFSTPEGFRGTVETCERLALPLVSGTTGLTADDEARLDRLVRVVPVLRAANFSIGIAVLRRALAAALAGLPEGWDVEIVERHHRGKADAPSGTALVLARDAAAARGWGEDAFRHGRSGRTGARPAREIGLHAVRGGSWVGDHAVLLAGPGETLELRHTADDRLAFAHGALTAVRFVAMAKPGRYSIEDVVGGR